MRDVSVGELESLLANRIGNPRTIQSIIDAKKKVGNFPTLMKNSLRIY